MNISKTLKTGVTALISTFLLAGCMTVNADYTFHEGLVDAEVKMSIDIAGMQEMAAEMGSDPVDVEDLNSLSEEEIKEQCAAGGLPEVGDPENFEITGTVEDGKLTCLMSGTGIDIDDLSTDSLNISYDEATSIYSIAMSPMELADADEEMMKIMEATGVEVTSTMRFNSIEEVIVKGEIVSTDQAEEIDGLVLGENYVTFDMMELKDSVTVTASDEKPGFELFGFGLPVILGAAAVLLSIIGAIVYFVLIGKRNENPDDDFSVVSYDTSDEPKTRKSRRGRRNHNNDDSINS